MMTAWLILVSDLRNIFKQKPIQLTFWMINKLFWIKVIIRKKNF